MHLKNSLLHKDKSKTRRSKIAFSGNTGSSTGLHLHYELWINQQAVNPVTAKLPRSEVFIDQSHHKYINS